MSEELKTYRRLSFYAAAIYFAWWVAVHFIFPAAFNPFGSRLAVVSLIFALPALSYRSALVRRHLRALFIASSWLITAHYFYLFYGNDGDGNWLMGSYITVIAINMALPSSSSLAWYSAFVLLLSGGIVGLIPALGHSVFLPGIVTIVVQANLALHARLKALRNLEESNQRFQLLFHSSFEGVFVHENRKILAANEAFARISGYSLQELIGRDALSLIPPDERARVQKNIAADTGVPHETLALRKDGSLLEIELRGKDFAYDHRPARLVTVQPVDDRKRAERARAVAQAMQESLRQRDEFLTIASHELKTPLSSLKMQTQIIARQLERDPAVLTPAKLGDFSALVGRQVERLNHLVETMLDVSLLSATRIELHLERFDLARSARDLIARAREQAGKAAPALELEAPPELFLDGDRSRLEQLFEHLLSNALKYGNGRPIHVRLENDTAEALLVFEDHGIGIAAEDLERIFGRFERAVSAHSISGLGLGLYLARRIAEAHGGRIDVVSEPGIRTVFTVRLPRNAAAHSRGRGLPS